MTKLCCPKYGKNITTSMFRSRGIKHDHGKSIKHNKYDIQQIKKTTVEN